LYRDGVPRVVDHQQRREQIVSATRSVLASNGLDGTTMRNIARHARCTTGRITHYFDSKDELMIAVLRSIHCASRQRLERELEPGDDALRRTILSTLPLDAERRDEWAIWVSFWANAIQSDALRSELSVRYAAWTELLAGILGTRSDDPNVTLLVAWIDGLGTRIVLDPNGIDGIEAIVDATLANLHTSSHPPSPAP
jgi:TetR/AcrR family transcriptional repressor of bet genes